MAKLPSYDLTDAAGEPAAFPLNGLWVPSGLRVEGDHLVYRGRSPGRVVAATPSLLKEFLRVASAADVFVFARRWGILGLCAKHALPFTHRVQLGEGEEDDMCSPIELPTDGEFAEWIGDWLTLRAHADAILKIAARLQTGQLGATSDWRVLATFGLRRSSEHWLGPIAAQRQALAELINLLIQIGQVRPHFSWDSASPRIDLAGSLLSAIAMQLMAAVTRDGGVAWCSAHHDWFRPRGRAPKRGTLNYCQACRANGKAQRHAVRASRSRAADRIATRGTRTR
jgi:hypothetical protein